MTTQTANPKTFETQILRRIQGHSRGSVISARDFADLGTRSTVDWVLQRLMAKGEIRRLSRGIYDYPQTSVIVGLVPPDPYQVARAITSREGSRLQPTGAYASNLLGLSDQIPARSEFLTESDERLPQIGNQEITLRKTTPRLMQMAGKISGLVTQAFRFMGKNSSPQRSSPSSGSNSARRKKTPYTKTLPCPRHGLPTTSARSSHEPLYHTTRHPRNKSLIPNLQRAVGRCTLNE